MLQAPLQDTIQEIEINRLIVNKVGVVIAKYNKDVYCYSCKARLKFIRKRGARMGKNIWYCPKCQKYMSENLIPIIPPRLMASRG